jgi:RNA polymerase sigma-70 factor, ECF subfamily
MSPAARPQLRLVAAPAEYTRAVGERSGESAQAADALLVMGLRARDESLAELFYERARPLIDRTLGRLLGRNDPDYEDVAQIALHELLESIDSFRRDCPLDAWISILTARTAYRQLRRRRVERRIFSAQPIAHVESLTKTLPAPFAAREALARLVDHLTQMDEGKAWSYLLHDAYGYDLTEIAQILDISLSAAQSRLVRGRRELHQRIEDDPELARFLDGLSEEVP